MPADNFAACLAVTLRYEGGFSAARADPGNWTGGKVGVGTLAGTNYGISAAAHPMLDIRGLTRDSVAPIYRDGYWAPAGCDALAAGLDLSHFDATVNSGRASASKWLAKARQATGEAAQVRAYANARLSFLEALRTWKSFGRGWSTRVAGVEAKALTMAAAPSTIADAAASHARSAAAAATVSAAAKVASGAAIVAATTTTHPAAAGAFGTSSVAVALVSGFFAWRNRVRAAALTHAA